MKKFLRTFSAGFIVLILIFFILQNQAFANENLNKENNQKEDCSPYSLCLEKQAKIKRGDQDNPFHVTKALLKEPTPKKEKEKNAPEIHLNKKIPVFANAHPLNADLLFNLVNDYRTKLGLSSFQKDERVCEIVKERTNEINNEIFVTGRLHAGFYARNLPFWATENLIYAQTEEKALHWWLNSSIHRAAIVSSHKYSCLECSGNSCSQVFTDFNPK